MPVIRSGNRELLHVSSIRPLVLWLMVITPQIPASTND
jgi:hypothetical protein